MKFNKGDILVPKEKQFPEGALVVDGYDEAGRLMAHPMGGGLQFCIEARGVEGLRLVDEAERARVLFRRGIFVLAESEERFVGWTDGRLWNGWEMPHFTRANADLLMALWNAAGEKLAEDPKACLQSVMSYDAERDAYIVTFPEDEQATETFEIENILVDGEYVRVYAIGAGSWTWDREDTAEDAYMATLSSHVTSLDPTKGYIIVDAKGDGYYNDTTVYDTPEAAEIALAEAQAWAQEEAKREPSWALAKLRIEEVSK